MKILAAFLLILSTTAWSGTSYYGAKSTEAILRFNASIKIKTSRALTVAYLNGSTPKALEIQAEVDEQLSYLIGHFQSESFLKTFTFPGVLGDKNKFKFISVEEREGNHQVLNYRFEGKSVFATKAFAQNDEISVPVRLPLDLQTFYKKGVVNGKNKCTDEHYDSEGDLFYFWDPDKRGCPLKNDTTHVLRFDGTLTKLENTKLTYPEYNKIFENEELKISVFLGYIDDEPKNTNTDDIAYATYEEISDLLVKQGYKVTKNKTFKTLNHLITLEKMVRNQLGYEQKIIVNILLTDSSVTTKDSTFETYFAEALMNSNVVAYDGHSGLGGNLDINRFLVDKLPSFYQVFFFNGCSSYPYFNSVYFSQKPAGKKNLEIITAGLPTLTSTSTTNMMAFLTPFVSGRIHSYQTLLRSLERSNEEEDTYLMGVNGDEDNVFKP